MGGSQGAAEGLQALREQALRRHQGSWLVAWAALSQAELDETNWHHQVCAVVLSEVTQLCYVGLCWEMANLVQLRSSSQQTCS